MFSILLTVLVICLGVLRWQRRNKIRWCSQFKNDFFSLPIIGFAYMLFGDGKSKSKLFQAFGREAIKQGGITSLHCWIANSFYTVVADAEVADLVMRKCLEKDDTMKMFESFCPKVLVVVSVPEWRPRRKTLNPSFATKNISQYFQIFRENSNLLVKALQEKIESKDSFSIYDYISVHSFHIFIETTFGVSATPTNTINKALEALTVCFNGISNRILQPLLYNNFLYELTPMYKAFKIYSGTLKSFIAENVNNMKFTHYKQNKNNESGNEQCIGAPKSILHNMVECSSVPLSKKYIERETMILVLAGSDTVTTAFSFACLLLGKYPDVQEKVYNELQEVLRGSERSLEIEDLPMLKYTDAVLRESMRLYPPGAVLLRKVDKDLVLPSGQILIKDTSVAINAWAIHRNPKYWGEDAEHFRPERFIDAPPKPPGAFLPFGHGPRNCIGYQFAMMSMKTCLATLVRQLRFLPVVDQDIQRVPAYENMETTFDILLRDAANFHMRVQARH